MLLWGSLYSYNHTIFVLNVKPGHVVSLRIQRRSGRRLCGRGPPKLRWVSQPVTSEVSIIIDNNLIFPVHSSASRTVNRAPYDSWDSVQWVGLHLSPCHPHPHNTPQQHPAVMAIWLRLATYDGWPSQCQHLLNVMWAIVPPPPYWSHYPSS